MYNILGGILTPVSLRNYKTIHQNISAGAAVRQNPHEYLARARIDKLHCKKHINLA
jgi:hypothetical protein